jgi:transcriptional regulator with XRE-family HTH domain
MTRSVFFGAYETLLACLVEARKASGITQVELADQLKRPQSFVSKFENGDRRIDVVEFIEICRALGVDPAGIVKSVHSTWPD